MQKRIVRVATRKSALALAQARAWMREFEASSAVTTEEVHVVTTGDRIVDRALNEVGGKGLFIKEIEEALIEHRADCALHSLKDVPALLAPGLELGCVPRREDPRDVVVTRTGCRFEELPKGAKVGTSSLRRVVQLRAVRPDLEYLPIRGNVDTRLGKCEGGVVDAVILALAGMRRLGIESRVTHALDTDVCLPAVGQGALVIELREGDGELRTLLAPLAHDETWLAVWAERGVLEAVEGNCQVPVAAHAVREGDELVLRCMLAEPDGTRLRRRQTRAPWPKDVSAAAAVGHRLGLELLDKRPDGKG
jgi:hydroxymethylbilane synthase